MLNRLWNRIHNMEIVQVVLDAPLLREADLFLLSSRHEAGPVAVLHVQQHLQVPVQVVGQV